MSLQVHTSDSVFRTKPDVVVFDLDNTLYSYGPSNEAGMDAVRERMQRDFRVGGKQFDDAFAAARKSIKADLGHTASSHSRLLYFVRTLEELGMKAQPLLSLDLEQLFWREYLAASSLEEGVEDFLIFLRSCGIPVALVSDLTTQIQLRKMVYLGIDAYFDVTVMSEECKTDKVGMEPYRLLRRKMALPHNARVWMIGDAACDVVSVKDEFTAFTLQKLGPHQQKQVFDGVDVGFHSFLSLLKEVEAW